MRQTLLFGHIIRREALNSIMTGQISGWQSELDRGKMLDSLLWWHGRMSSIEFNQSTRDQNWVHPEHYRSKLGSSRAPEIKIGFIQSIKDKNWWKIIDSHTSWKGTN